MNRKPNLHLPTQHIATHLLKYLLLSGFLIYSTDSFTQPAALFESDEVFEITLKFEMKNLQKDRGDDPQYHEATLHYTENEIAYDIPLRIKARGNFRKMTANCKYPPLWINFKKSETPQTSIFRDQDKTKLVTPCRDDQLVIQEYLVYRLYNLLTPMSFRARLVKVTYHDLGKDKTYGPYYGVLLEEEEQLAKRNHCENYEKQGLNPQSTDEESFLRMAVFQYMIGNTDWSVQFQQNIKYLVHENTNLPMTVPCDFDHAGIVRAPYAHPAPELQMASTLQRRYRGYCVQDMNEFTAIFQVFNQLKEDFYDVYKNNTLITDKYREQTLKFLDDFYATINDHEKAKVDFLYPCDKNGTGNVIIKGLNVD